MWLLLCLIPILCYATYNAYKSWAKKYEGIDKLPGPPTKPIVGNALDFGYNNIDILKNIGRYFEKYGRVMRVWLGPFDVTIFTTDPRYCEQIMASSKHLDKGSRYSTMEDVFGRGLFIESGEIYKANKKLITPAFHYKVLDQFATTFHTVNQRLIKALNSKGDSTFNVYDVIKLYALDALCATTMGVEVQSLEGGRGFKYTDMVDLYLSIAIKRFFSLWKRYDVFFKYASEYKAYQEAVVHLHTFCTYILNERSEQRKKANLDGNNKLNNLFVDLLLESERLTFKEKRNEVQCMITAGYDTVASSLSFTLYELSKHPDIQEKILEELERVVGLDKDTVITTKHLDDMPYIERVFKEGLRLYHPVPMIERVTVEDIEIDGVKIPKGTELAYHIFWLHRDKEYFPNPLEFNPDRFLEEMEKFVYVPFSAGTRNCLGYKHGTINSKVTLLNILRNFELIPVPNHTPVLATEGTLKSYNGLPIKLRRRT